MSKPTNTNDFKASSIKINPEMLAPNDSYVTPAAPAKPLTAQEKEASKDYAQREQKKAQRLGHSYQPQM